MLGYLTCQRRLDRGPIEDSVPCVFSAIADVELRKNV
jgi:hypothetical protein